MSNFNLKTENIRVSEDPMRTHRNSCSHGRFKVRTHSINTRLAPLVSSGTLLYGLLLRTLLFGV